MIFQHYSELLRSHRWLIAIIVIFSTAVFGAASYYKINMSPDYTAAASVTMMPSEAELTFSQEGLNQKAATRTLTETYTEYVKSSPVIKAALAIVKEKTPVEEDPLLVIDPTGGLALLIDKAKSAVRRFRRMLVELNTGTYAPLSAEDAEVAAIRSAIEVTNVTNTHILRIQVTLPDPDAAALLANTLADAYVKEMAAQVNEDASELEGYLKGEIRKKESEVERLRAERKRLLERFGVLQDGGGVEDQLLVVQGQLDELNNRLLTINLSRVANGTGVRTIEPAIAPPYPSSAGVVQTSLIGLLAGLVLSVAAIVIRDTLSGTIKTTTDLQRAAGIYGIGLLRRGWVSRKHKRPLKRLGQQFEQQVAAMGFGDVKRLPKPREPLKLAPPVMEEEFIQYEEGGGVGSVRPMLAAIGKMKKERLGPAHKFRTEHVVQVTGLLPMKNLCWATIGISAALATAGNHVFCKLPDGKIKRPPKIKPGKAGYLTYEDPRDMEELESYVTVECVGPINIERDLVGEKRNHPVICVLPANEISEDFVQALRKRLAAKKSNNVYFLLLAR